MIIMDQATSKETRSLSKNYNQSIKYVSPHDYYIIDGGGSGQMITVLRRESLLGMVKQMITVSLWVNSNTVNGDDHYDIMMTLLMTLTTIALGSCTCREHLRLGKHGRRDWGQGSCETVPFSHSCLCISLWL